MDEYLKILLEQIRCKKARPYIRQELQNHMKDQIEANIHAVLCSNLWRSHLQISWIGL